VADLGRQPLDRRGDHAQSGEEHGVAVARDHLGGDGLDAEPQLLSDMGLDARIDVGEGPDRARDRAGGDVVAGRGEAGAVAGEFGISLRQLEAEGDRLGVDAVAAADRRRQLVLEGAALQHRQQSVEIRDQDVRRAAQLHREAGVEHVGAGHAQMEEARLRPDPLGGPGQEGDDVVLHDGLDRVDRGDVDRRIGRPPVADRLGRFPGHRAELGHRVERVRLDLEPDAVTRLRFPERSHCGAGVAGDHEAA